MLNKSAQKHQSFLYATMILGVSTILVKIMGAIFKIPLTNLIGEVGMGYFSTAYDVYLPIYSLAMAGLPIAVSRIVARYVAENRYNDAKKAFKLVKRLFLFTGLIGFVLMFGVSFLIVSITRNENALPAMFVIAPSILFCCIMSSYRGYYEGMRNMFPTAISSLIEAASKLFLGYSFAYAVVKLKILGGGVEFAAAGAMLGITVGTALGSLYLLLRHKIKGDGVTAQQLLEAPQAADSRVILKAIIAISIPVALGSLVNQIASLIDVAMVQRQLQSGVAANESVYREMYGHFLFDEKGNTLAAKEIPNFLYGCYKGYAYTIFNLVPTVTSVIGISALPALTVAWTEGKNLEIKKNIESILKVITLIAFPAGIGIMALSPQIVDLLFPTDADITPKILAILGGAACFAGMTTPLTNMLQAIGKPSVPLKNIAVGAVIKIVVNFILVGVPAINILGAPIGTLLCYIYIAVADIFCLVKYSRTVPSLYKSVLKPLFAAIVCGAVAFGANLLLSTLIGSGRITTVISLALAVVAYILAVAVIKCIDEDDIRTLSKGDKVVRICAKLHIIRQ